MTTPLIIAAVFVSVTALVGGVALMFRGTTDEVVSQRLEALARTGSTGSRRQETEAQASVLVGPLDDIPSALESLFSRMRLRRLLDQADVSLSPAQLVALVLGLGVAGTVLPAVAGLHLVIGPPLGLILAIVPLLWLLWKRKRRLTAFAQQLPEALELVARALRAGHSLASGLHLVGDEMTDPIAGEFTRVFEEQNLGIALEDAMDSMTDRVPNLDLRFFATAVILQRQTGGDLAEILDKIGYLIRERFKIYGQIQALTGEGRLSGIVLLAMPPALFLLMLRLNYDYVMLLFREDLGLKMLAGALLLQLLGAVVIRKIVNIKV